MENFLPQENPPKNSNSENLSKEFIPEKQEHVHSQVCCRFVYSEDADFNLKSAIAHLQSDLIFSVGVFLGAIIINIFPKARFIDSIFTFVFSILVIRITIPIFKESFRVLLNGASESSKNNPKKK